MRILKPSNKGSQICDGGRATFVALEAAVQFARARKQLLIDICRQAGEKLRHRNIKQCGRCQSGFEARPAYTSL